MYHCVGTSSLQLRATVSVKVKHFGMLQGDPGGLDQGMWLLYTLLGVIRPSCKLCLPNANVFPHNLSVGRNVFDDE